MLKKIFRFFDFTIVLSFVVLCSIFATHPATADGVPLAYVPPSKCKAEEKSYMRLDGGYSFPHGKFGKEYGGEHDGAFFGTIGSGHIINDKYRVDVTATHRGKYEYLYKGVVAPESQKVFSNAFMLNGYFDFKLYNRAKVYLMGGVGLAINDAGVVKTKKADGTPESLTGRTFQSFAWQVGIGSWLKIRDCLYADLMYKYVDLGKMRMKDVVYVGGNPRLPEMKNGDPESKWGHGDGDIRVHEISLGIIYKF